MAPTVPPVFAADSWVDQEASVDDAPVDDAPVDTPRRNTRRKDQKSVQVLAFAALMNREHAAKLSESPKVVAAAAIVAFQRLDPAVQLDLIRETRERHLRD